MTHKKEELFCFRVGDPNIYWPMSYYLAFVRPTFARREWFITGNGSKDILLVIRSIITMRSGNFKIDSNFSHVFF